MPNNNKGSRGRNKLAENVKIKKKDIYISDDDEKTILALGKKKRGDKPYKDLTDAVRVEFLGMRRKP